MQSFQNRILEQLEQIATKSGCVLIQQASAGNVGKVLAQKSNPAFDGPIVTVAYASYHFQGGHNKITFNGAPLGPGDMSELFKEHEDAKINRMLATWRRLIQDGLRGARGVKAV